MLAPLIGEGKGHYFSAVIGEVIYVRFYCVQHKLKQSQRKAFSTFNVT